MTKLNFRPVKNIAGQKCLTKTMQKLWPKLFEVRLNNLDGSSLIKGGKLMSLYPN